jgi:hypothetical protein
MELQMPRRTKQNQSGKSDSRSLRNDCTTVDAAHPTRQPNEDNPNRTSGQKPEDTEKETGSRNAKNPLRAPGKIPVEVEDRKRGFERKADEIYGDTTIPTRKK